MSAGSWVLKGIDPAAREAAQAEAERLGVSVAEYLTMALEAGAAPEPEEAPMAPRGGGQAMRHRLDSVERRVQAAIANFDDALQAVDDNMYALAERFDAAEAAGRDNGVLIAELQESLMAVAETAGERLDAAERDAADVRAAQAELGEKQTALEARIAEVASDSVAALADASQTIVSELDRDLEAFEIEMRGFVDSKLSQAKAAAEAAAQRADMALAQALEDIRAVRTALEDRVAASEATAETAIAAVREETQALSAVMAERIAESDRRGEARLQTMSAEIQGVATRASKLQSALDAAVAKSHADLGAADAALRAEIAAVRDDAKTMAADATRDAYAATADLRLDMSSADATLRDEIHTVREATLALVTELRMEGENADAELAREIESVAHAGETARTELRREFNGALEDLRNNQLGANARLRLLDEAIGADPAVAPVGTLTKRMSRLEAELADRAFDKAVEERLAKLEAQLDQSHVETALSRLGTALHELAERPATKLDDALLARFDGFGARLNVQETVAQQAALSRKELEEGLADVSSRMTQAFASTGEAMQAMERRLAQLQEAQGAAADQRTLAAMQAAFDTRIEALSQMIVVMAAETRGELTAMTQAMRHEDNGALAALEQRIAESEARQRDMATALSGELAQLSAMLERTKGEPASAHDLATIASIIEDRLSAIERHDDNVSERIAQEVGAIRSRIEERFAQIEQRSVRAIERLGESVALIGQKLNQRQDDMVLELADRVGVKR